MALPADVLQRYIGKYALRPGFDFRVTIEDEQLMLESAGPQVIGLRR